MSTDVFGYRTLKKEGNKLTVKVFNVYRDWKGFFPSPSNPTFFYSIIAKMNEGLQERFKKESGHAWYSEESMRLLGQKYIGHVDVTDIENPFAKMKALFYYEKDGKWKDEKKLPQVTYDIEVSDEALLKNIKVGHSAGTTCYQADLPILHNLNSKIPKIDRLDPLQLATLPWVGNLQSLVHAMDNLLSEDQDTVGFFNARPTDRDKLLGRLRLLIHDPLCAQNGWDLEIIGLLNRFRMKDGADEALLKIMAKADDTYDVNCYLIRLAVSAGTHPAYITSALQDLAKKMKDEEGQFWLNYILYRGTGDKKYKTAFTKQVSAALAITGDDRPYYLTRLQSDVWHYHTADELTEWASLIKKLKEDKHVY